jgi:hypothetical protein
MSVDKWEYKLQGNERLYVDELPEFYNEIKILQLWQLGANVVK